jgi:hypothetical protein
LLGKGGGAKRSDDGGEQNGEAKRDSHRILPTAPSVGALFGESRRRDGLAIAIRRYASAFARPLAAHHLDQPLRHRFAQHLIIERMQDARQIPRAPDEGPRMRRRALG